MGFQGGESFDIAFPHPLGEICCCGSNYCWSYFHGACQRQDLVMYALQLLSHMFAACGLPSLQD